VSTIILAISTTAGKLSHRQEYFFYGHLVKGREVRKIKHICNGCGRTISAIKVRGEWVTPPDEDHDLCPRCWQSILDSDRLWAHESAHWRFVGWFIFICTQL